MTPKNKLSYQEPKFVGKGLIEYFVEADQAFNSRDEQSIYSNYLVSQIDQNQYLYTLRYDEPMTGRTAFDLISEEQPGYFIPDIFSFDFGDALFGLEIGDDQDAGFGTKPEYLDYWHYWTKESASADWDMSMIGFSDRILSDGSADGWVFNSNNAPTPAPAAITAVLGLGLIRRRRG